MKRLLKGLAIVAFALILLFVGGGLWLRYQYPPDRIRRMAADRLGKRLGRQIEIADARISLWHGLELKGIRLSEASSFSAGTFFEADRVRVLHRWLPLLSRHIMVRSIDIDRPRVTIRRSAEGLFNFADLEKSTGPTENGGEAPSPVLFLISRAALSDGEIVFQDDRFHLLIKMRKLDARVSGFSLTDPFGLQVKGDLEVRKEKSLWKGPLALKAHLTPVGDRPVTLEKFHVGLGSSALDLAGTITPLPTPLANVTLTLTSLAAADLTPLFPLPDPIKNARLAGQWTIQATSSTANAYGTFDAQAPLMAMSGSMTLNTDGVHHQVQLQPKSFRLEDSPLAPGFSGSGPLGGRWDISVSSAHWNIKGELTGDGAVFSYEDWLKKPASSPFTLTGTVTENGPNGPTVDLDLRAPEINIIPGGPWPKDLHLSGTAGLTAEVRGTPDNLAFDVSCDGRSIDTAYKNAFHKPTSSALSLSSTGKIKKNFPLRSGEGGKRDLEISEATIRMSAGIVDVKGNINDFMNTRFLHLTINGKTTDLSRVEPLLPSLTHYRLRGQTTLDATVNGPATGPLVTGQIHLSNAAATPTPGLDLSEMDGQINFYGDTAEIRSLKGKAFGSPFTLTGKIDHFDRPTIELDGRWERLEIEKWLKTFSPAAPAPKQNSTAPQRGAPPATPSPTNKGVVTPQNAERPPLPAPIASATGIFRIGEIVHPHYLGRDFQFKWALTDVGPNLSLLSGNASVTAASGEITNIPLAKKINKLMDRDGSDISYKKMAGTFLVTRGITEVQSFVLNSDQTDFSAHGHVRLGDMESDLRLMLKLPPGSVRGSVGNWMTADDGRPTIEASLKGPLGDPKVKVDYRDTVRRAAQDILKKTLGGWKGKPDRATANPEPSSPPTPAPPAALEKEMQDPGRRSLEKIFKQ